MSCLKLYDNEEGNDFELIGKIKVWLQWHNRLARRTYSQYLPLVWSREDMRRL